jgi:hypothetical protein
MDRDRRDTQLLRGRALEHGREVRRARVPPEADLRQPGAEREHLDRRVLGELESARDRLDVGVARRHRRQLAGPRAETDPTDEGDHRRSERFLPGALAARDREPEVDLVLSRGDRPHVVEGRPADLGDRLRGQDARGGDDQRAVAALDRDRAVLLPEGRGHEPEELLGRTLAPRIHFDQSSVDCHRVRSPS